MTNAYAEGDQYFNQLTAELPYLSSYLPEIQSTAIELLKRIYRNGYKYRKVMIGLTGLERNDKPQYDLFDNHQEQEKKLEPLMEAFDRINERYGRGTVKLACGLTGKKLADSENPWLMRRDYLSPRYTTNIAEIPLVY